MTIEYMRCPFCSSEEILIASQGEGFVSCKGCGACGPDYGQEGRALKSVIEGARQLWNQRPKDGDKPIPVRHNPAHVISRFYEVYDPDFTVMDLEY